MIVRKLLIFTLLITTFSVGNLFSKEGDEPEKFDAKNTILHHVLDTHDWHITDYPAGTDADGKTIYKGIALHLPWFFYSSQDGFQFVGSTHGLIDKGYFAHHDHLYALKPGVDPDVDEHGHMHLDDKEFEAWKEANIVDGDEKKVEREGKTMSLYDLSMTKASLHMLLIGILLIIVFSIVARSYTRNKGKAPSGIQSFLEPLIIFIRDEIAKEYLGHNAKRFLPYLLSLFFFIWFANLLGLMPFNSNVMGNISVTAALALLTFILVNINGNKNYWKHIFNTTRVRRAY